MNAWIDITSPRTCQLDSLSCPSDPASKQCRSSTLIEAPTSRNRRVGVSHSRMLEFLFGPARLIDLRAGNGPVQKAEIVAYEERGGFLARGDKAVLRLGSRRSGGISLEAARYLASLGLAVVGVDFHFDSEIQGEVVSSHRILLKAGVWVIEGLDLSRTAEGDYLIAALPLEDPGAEATTPARVALQPIAASCN